jgi:hypothetical protein
MIDHTEYILVEDACSDCGTSSTRRVVEDIGPVRPTAVTCYAIEHRRCSQC